MNIPESVKYSKMHVWCDLLENGNARVGLTEYALKRMGKLIYVDLPEIGEKANKNRPICEVESEKAISEVYAPVNGVISEVNSALENGPERIYRAPYQSWFIELSDIVGAETLMDAKQYRAYLEEDSDD